MPTLRNYTPFPNFRYYSMDNRGEEFGVIIVKATFELAPSGRLLVAEEQAPMMFTDVCHGAVNASSLWHPSDLVPFKPRADIITNAVARAPKGAPAASWNCGVRLEQGEPAYAKLLKVTGPRYWRPKWRRNLSDDEKRDWRRHRADFEGWELSTPEPIAELPLHYEYAFGGILQKGVDENGKQRAQSSHDNPLGRGWIDKEWTDHTAPVPAPQIEDAREPISEPYKAYPPQSLGPIPPAWLPRRALGGTYDRNWKEKVWPNWPADYDFAYHNSAHPDLILPTLLKGDERITLGGFLAERQVVTFRLPGETLAVDFDEASGLISRELMTLDTAFFDIAAPELRDWRVYLTWRVRFEPDRFTQASIIRTAGARSPEAVRRSIKERQNA
jgi:hypothetical protein